MTRVAAPALTTQARLPILPGPLTSTPNAYHNQPLSRDLRSVIVLPSWLQQNLLLVLVVVSNDAALMRALFLVLLVPLFADMQRRLWHLAQRRFADDFLACVEVARAEYRQARQREA